ncbi:protein FAM78B isoform 2-T2 [Odontesthes bonariensis]|uniref:protein FAM78B isoform X2 n=1 Tax=Odontesthes bonariensis TaxID=219752 RepID=UPI003F58DD54
MSSPTSHIHVIKKAYVRGCLILMGMGERGWGSGSMCHQTDHKTHNKQTEGGHQMSKLSSWELPQLREGLVRAISDSDGVSYPWYGNTTETVTIVGPTSKPSRFIVSMNDNFYPSVTWAVPVSESNTPLLTNIKRDQSFTTWLVALNTTSREKILLHTIKWRMRVDIVVDPSLPLGSRAKLVGRLYQDQPRVLTRMEPIPHNAMGKPNANDAQVLMWRPRRGPPLVVIPPK